MSTPAPDAKPKRNFFKILITGFLGLLTGAIAMYFNAAFDRFVKPAKPLANFQVSTDGLTVACENRATGQSGYWDFGDGSALEPFDPNQQTVTHTYPKPGKYDVNLIVRNFLMEEADRKVTVELAAPAQTSVNAPQVSDLKVETIGDQVPATIRITGKVTNADELIWKLGDKTEHLASPSEEIDRYVRIDKPGSFPIVLTALSKSRKDPQVIVQAVDVKPMTKDSYEAMVSVTDTVMKVESRGHLARLPAPVRDAAGPTKGFSRGYAASPNCYITKAELDKSMPANVAKNVKVEVSKDQKMVTVTGEWAVSGDALAKAAGGGDIQIPIVVTEESRTPTSPGRQVLTGMMDASQKIVVEIPPRKLGSATRQISVDFGFNSKERGRTRVAYGTLDAQGNWQSAPVSIGGQAWCVKAVTRPDSKVEVTLVPAK